MSEERQTPTEKRYREAMAAAPRKLVVTGMFSKKQHTEEEIKANRKAYNISWRKAHPGWNAKHCRTYAERKKKKRKEPCVS